MSWPLKLLQGTFSGLQDSVRWQIKDVQRKETPTMSRAGAVSYLY